MIGRTTRNAVLAALTELTITACGTGPATTGGHRVGICQLRIPGEGESRRV